MFHPLAFKNVVKLQYGKFFFLYVRSTMGPLNVYYNTPSTKKNPPSTFIDFITKVSDIIAEPNDDFLSHFEL